MLREFFGNLSCTFVLFPAIRDNGRPVRLLIKKSLWPHTCPHNAGVVLFKLQSTTRAARPPLNVLGRQQAPHPLSHNSYPHRVCSGKKTYVQSISLRARQYLTHQHRYCEDDHGFGEASLHAKEIVSVFAAMPLSVSQKNRFFDAMVLLASASTETIE